MQKEPKQNNPPLNHMSKKVLCVVVAPAAMVDNQVNWFKFKAPCPHNGDSKILSQEIVQIWNRAETVPVLPTIRPRASPNVDIGESFPTLVRKKNITICAITTILKDKHIDFLKNITINSIVIKK